MAQGKNFIEPIRINGGDGFKIQNDLSELYIGLRASNIFRTRKSMQKTPL